MIFSEHCNMSQTVTSYKKFLRCSGRLKDIVALFYRLLIIIACIITRFTYHETHFVLHDM